MDENTLYIEPRNIFDSCIIGYHLELKSLIYDYDSLVCGFQKTGMTYEQSIDHISFNIIGAEGNMYYPIIGYDYE